MVAPTVKEPTDTDPGTSAKWGAPDAVQLVTIIKGTHASERVPVAAIEGVAVSLSATQTITGPKTFNDQKLKLSNPAGTFSYIFIHSAIAADRNITVPLLVSDDTLVMANHVQTLTNKTINAASNTLTGVARTDAGNTFGDFDNSFKDNRLLINNPADTFAYTIIASAIGANRNVTLPLLTANDTFVTANFAQTLTNKTIGDPTDPTKAFVWTLSGATTLKTLTLISSHTNDRSITLPDATTTLVGTDTTQTLSNKTLTAPKYANGGYVADANGNELFIYTTTASAINEVTFANAATTGYPTFTASGGDADVGIKFVPKGAGYVLGNMETLVIALGDETTAITTGTAKVTFRMPYAFKVNKVKASLTTASTSGTPTFDIKEGGVSIMTTNKLVIDANELTTATALTPAVITDSVLADDAEITIDVTVAGTGAKGAKVYIIGYATAIPA